MIDPIDPNAGAWQAAEAAMAASGAVGASDGGPDASLLTPDTLMAYCQSRLSSLDSQMQSTFAQQEKSNALTSAINDLAGAMDQNTNGINDPPGSNLMSDQDFGNLKQKFEDLIQKAGGPDSPIGKQIANALGTLTAGNDTAVSASEITNIGETLKQAASDVNSGAELNMINLQSLMSQRQTAIQLTTNLVQSLGDQMNKVADNIGK